MIIKILKPGMLTTIQDLGRYGYAHLGISPAGAADSLSFRIANLLVGNDEDAPALEMTLLGAAVEFGNEAVIAIGGADIQEASGVPTWRAIRVPAGFVLDCGSLSNGARAYLAVQGGFRVPRVMNSASTLIAGGFGGFQGRALRSGDVLDVGENSERGVRVLPPELLELLRRDRPIRVTQGVQWDWFDENTTERFLTSTFTVSPLSNRAGLRLQGESLATRTPAELLTEGVTLGTIQVPPGGQPIILLVDQQTTGGYPKIANVISADVHLLGQALPGDSLRFELVSIDRAVQILREQEAMLCQAFRK